MVHLAHHLKLILAVGLELQVQLAIVLIQLTRVVLARRVIGGRLIKFVLLLAGDFRQALKYQAGKHPQRRESPLKQSCFQREYLRYIFATAQAILMGQDALMPQLQIAKVHIKTDAILAIFGAALLREVLPMIIASKTVLFMAHIYMI